MVTMDGRGSATIEGESSPILVADGPVARSTIERLLQGYSSRPLPPEAVEGIRSQALLFVEDLLRAYSTQVAQAELGLGGTARAADDGRTGGNCPTGLLYGRVQSGKTNAMVLSTALAIDNGFRVVVVLTSDNTALVEQTAKRFRVLDEGPLVYASTQWDEDKANIARHLPRSGVVLVCSKNRSWLSSLLTLSVSAVFERPAITLFDGSRVPVPAFS